MTVRGGFPAGQHFIPKMLQKRFVDDDGMLWAFDRRRPARGCYRSTPKDAFRERHLYTVMGPTGLPDALVERTLGQIEGAAEPIIDRVVRRVRSGGSYNLREEDRSTLLLFLYVQHKRCPEFFRELQFDEPLKALVERSLAMWESHYGPVPPEERDKHLSPEGLAGFEQSVRMGALMSLSPKVLEALDARGLTIARITRADRRFVLASLPTVRFRSPSGRRDLGDPGTELWLPIAPDIAIATCGPRQQNQIVHLEHDPSIRKINEELARQSNTIASSSLPLLHSLTRRLPT